MIITPPPPDTNTWNLLLFTTNATPNKQFNAGKNMEIFLSEVPMDTNITTKDNTYENISESNKINNIIRRKPALVKIWW